MVKLQNKHIFVIQIAIIIGLSAAAIYMYNDLTSDRDEKNDFCELNGYQKALSYSTKDIEDVEYIQCYNVEIIDGKLIETDKWFVFKDGSDK